MGLDPSDQVTLNVSGREYHTTVNTLSSTQRTDFFKSLLTTWSITHGHAPRYHNQTDDFSSSTDDAGQPQKSITPSLYIDADPDLFTHILKYLRRGVFPLSYSAEPGRGHDHKLYMDLLGEARHFRLPMLEHWLSQKLYLRAVEVTTHARAGSAPNRAWSSDFVSTELVSYPETELKKWACRDEILAKHDDMCRLERKIAKKPNSLFEGPTQGLPGQMNWDTLVRHAAEPGERVPWVESGKKVEVREGWCFDYGKDFLKSWNAATLGQQQEGQQSYVVGSSGKATAQCQH